MTSRKYLIAAASLSGGGVVFAGYLSAVRFFASSCAFDEPCPTFLGTPACYIGLALFASLFMTSLGGLLGVQAITVMRLNLALAAAGTLFASYVAAGDLVTWRDLGVSAYRLGLPTCVYGGVFFLILLILSASMLPKGRVRRQRTPDPRPPLVTSPQPRGTNR